jgi:hypothetical protein
MEFQLSPVEVPHELMNKNCYLKCCNSDPAQGNLHVMTIPLHDNLYTESFPAEHAQSDPCVAPHIFRLILIG